MINELLRTPCYGLAIAGACIAVGVGLGPRGLGRAPENVLNLPGTCKLVLEQLGADPAPDWLGGRANQVFGSNGDRSDHSNTPAGHEGWAYGKFALSGQRASALFDYVAYYDQGNWVIEHAFLTGAGKPIDVLHCVPVQ